MISSKQLNYAFATIAVTTFTTFEFSPTGVPISTALATNYHGQVTFWAKLAEGRGGVRADVDKSARSPLGLDPRYNRITHYTTTIKGDLADVYFPSLPKSSHNATLPIALMLQGALVDKSNYSSFASQVASYGFVVVVPNHQRSLTGPKGQAATGLFSEEGQVKDVLAQMRVEDSNPASPIFKIVDTSKLGLLGHSFGGAVGLGATQEAYCQPGFCSGKYSRPPELKAGIFYGANFRNQTGEFLPINNASIPIGLIQGSLDGVAAPARSQATYDKILNPPKALMTIAGANHYSITNADNPQREPNRPTLNQVAALRTIARASGLFLRANLLSDRRAFDAVFDPNVAFDPNVSIISQTQPRQ